MKRGKLEERRQLEEPRQKIGRVKVSDTVSINIQRVRFKGKWYIDIRKYVETKKYTGLTVKGIMIPVANFPEVLEVLKKVKI